MEVSVLYANTFEALRLVHRDCPALPSLHYLQVKLPSPVKCQVGGSHRSFLPLRP
jgi:hypothetical protein